ncbi:MAG: hypothetical protein GF334_11125 [Candidatus Altiarchaeales archaeon]|nr:hypothetical protein [Candidatus Altiarchaeales archaeon]
MYFLVNDERRFFMGWSAKAACTSIKMWFCCVSDIRAYRKNVHSVLGYGHNKWTDLHSRKPETFQDYRKYIIIRNPYARLVSGYVDVYVKNLRSRKPWKTFSDFVHALENDNKFKAVDRHHFVPQTGEYFKKINDSVKKWDRVVCCTDLNSQIIEINKEIGVDCHLLIHNATFDKRFSQTPIPAYSMSDKEILRYKPSFPCFYNEELSRVVEKVYASDFDFFSSQGFHYSSKDM